MRIRDFLPVSTQDMERLGWEYYDFLLITGDSYVDHPSFGAAVIGRVLENAGYRVAIMAQPDYKNPSSIKALGRPRLAAMITGGNIDSMVANYTVSKKRRMKDAYTAGGRNTKRPDRAVIAYSHLVKKAYPDLPIVLGGLEASLRRFAHYDYWSDSVHPSILMSSQADILVYGMGEYATIEIAKRLDGGTEMR
ncbi:MAG: YgiQ family radical SAM protein, partial [Clostridiales bacterium]|nr:YgiQ family radical SAM protein [Clostridiales bacterium]